MALPFHHPAHLLATWFGAGLLPRMPGTWGSLAALPFAYAIYAWGGVAALAVAVAAVALGGHWAISVYLRHTDHADPQTVVVDEVAGQWLALLPAANDPLLLLAGFVAFRFFDTLKPWPCDWLEEHVPGAASVWLDDIAAGVYAAAAVIVLAWITGIY
jgi:phosphatidylglycerophosphatase A